MTDDSTHMNKVLDHGLPAGTPSTDAVKRRAGELAEVEGRPGNVTREDFERALSELQDTTARGEEGLDATEGDDARDASDPAGGRLERKPMHMAQEENAERENLALQGVEEAEHEQMLNARRNGGNQEG